MQISLLVEVQKKYVTVIVPGDDLANHGWDSKAQVILRETFGIPMGTTKVGNLFVA